MTSAGAESRRSRAATEAEPARSSADEVPAPVSYTALRIWLGLAIAGVGTWWVALIWMAVTSANPHTLNVRQLATADAILTGTVVQLEPGLIEIEHIWRTNDRDLAAELKVGERLEVARLVEGGAAEGGTFVVPLVGVEPAVPPEPVVETAKLGVAEIKMPSEEGKTLRYPVVYPATEHVLGQLETLLARLDGANDE